MKWENKGHEFEKEKYLKDKKILIYGAGEKGIAVYRLLEFLGVSERIKGFIDRRGGVFSFNNNIQVFKFTEMALDAYSDSIVILAGQYGNMCLFARQLRKIGLAQGKEFFFYEDFMDYYVHIFAFYTCGVVYAPFISMQVSSICNLKCKGCVAFTPENPTPRHFGLSESIQSIESIFANIDKINVLDVCGGEPFLMPHFGEIIQYIGEKHRKKINTLRTVTNGSIVPDDELCRTLYENKVTVVLDDYRENVGKIVATFPKVKEKLQIFNISVIVRKAEHWVDLGLKERKSGEWEKACLQRYAECSNIVKSIHDKKLYCCDYADFARQSGQYTALPTDYLDFSVPNDKAAVLEFLMGYTETGYCGMCKYCKGCVTINTCFIPVAEQIETIKEQGEQA